MTVRPTIAYCAPQAFHFVRKDIEGLRTKCTVLVHLFEHGAKWMLPFDLLHQLWFLLNARRSGVRDVFVHFGGYHAILPILLGFRTHIIIAGSDACSFPGIRYGGFRKQPLASVLRFVYGRATTLLPVHASLERFVNTFSEHGPTEQGYGTLARSTTARSVAIPYGFDVDQWPLADTTTEREGAICVAFGARWNDAVHFRKGLDIIIACARMMPTMRFTIVGVADPSGYMDVPGNLTVLGKVLPERLHQLLVRHSLYLQPSLMEGFPNAVCEAMLAGCVPIVSNITSMPDIVDGLGEVVYRSDATALGTAIQRVAVDPARTNHAARRTIRARIAPLTLERRIAALLAVTDQN
ncbi:MAG: glycosyltransferase family 4 protein [Flavobacteriales bacterium]